MKRPSRLEILEYALEGATTQRGLWSGNMSEELEEQLDSDIQWLEAEIERIKRKAQNGGATWIAR